MGKPGTAVPGQDRQRGPSPVGRHLALTLPPTPKSAPDDDRRAPPQNTNDPPAASASSSADGPVFAPSPQASVPPLDSLTPAWRFETQPEDPPAAARCGSPRRSCDSASPRPSSPRRP